MNKKVKGAILFIGGLLLAYVLISRRRIESMGAGEGSFLALFLNFFTLFFGTMAWFVCGLSIILGITMFLNKNIKINRAKILALVLVFLAGSLLLIRNSIKAPLPDSFTEAGRVLLGLGFNGQSGGLAGGLLSMPLYKVILSPIMGIFLILVLLMGVLYLLKSPFEYLYATVNGLKKYYGSDEYKEKVKLLKAKKVSEKLKRTDYKKYQKEELKKRIIESRNQKLSFELSKKPKENFLDKTETYTEEELEKKKKEWVEFSDTMEEVKRQPKINTESLEKSSIKTGNEESLGKKEADTIIPLKVERAEEKIQEEKLKEREVEANIQKEGLSAGTASENINKVNSLAQENDDAKTEKINKIEEISEGKEKVPENSEMKEIEGKAKPKEVIQEITEIPKIGAFEDIEAIERERKLEESIRNTERAALHPDQGYSELIKKSIEEIFKAKPMDLEKKFEIEKAIIDNVSHLENVLKQFGIDAKVVNYEYGPTITRYEITIPAGVKVSKVTSLSDDIAMNLAAESIRIEAPIPGKNTIGIETPNKIKEPVYFSNIIKNAELEKGELNVVLGKDIVGRDKIIDIAKMPHLLIAGQTGSGKSVAINTLISTLISKKSEKEVRFIMVDPKMVELVPYNDIPHLLVPVIIDPHQASIALKWAVNEMEKRYKILMENGVRNIKGYNSLKYVEKMPYIVIIIDELADLMMVASGSVEESIARIAQKARAIGIHLVVATQRPSTDVITGMIKANLPSRISFALRSQIDSRTILDSVGAEKLLGYGDMLLLENGSSKLERIQGAFISDEEVMDLTSTLKKNKNTSYMEEILSETSVHGKDTDPYFENAIEIIKQEKKVSISLLQRELRIGFNRASRIYDQLKEMGIISYDNQILIDDDLETEIKNK